MSGQTRAVRSAGPPPGAPVRAYRGQIPSRVDPRLALRSAAGILALQRTVGNRAVVQRLTEAERFENLVAPKYASNIRLQDAFDNQPALRFAERNHDAVRLVQQGLVADGFPLPKSTRLNGELDGVYGGETVDAVKAFQAKHELRFREGAAGREVLRRLDELELGDRVGRNSTDVQRRSALAIVTLIAQQQRVARLIRDGLASRPGGTAPSRRDVLFRNSCEWIDRGKATVHVLVPTHDFGSREFRRFGRASGRIAVFDLATAHPAVGGTYPLQPGPDEETHVKYVPPRFAGTTTNADIELVDPEQKTDDAIVGTLIHETQHVADRTEGENRGVPQGPGRVEVHDARGERDLQLEGHVNNYQTEFRAHWIERPEGDPQDTFGSATAPATNTRMVTFTDDRHTVRTAATHFTNHRQEAVFFHLIDSGYDVAGPYTTNAIFRSMVDRFDRPTGVNLVNSVRIDDLLNAISGCNTNMASRHPRIVAMLGFAQRLDESDRLFLRDTRLARPFHDHAGRHLNPTELGRLSGIINQPAP